MYENIAIARINRAVNGIELSFDGKPSYDVLKDLKENGFRWHYKKQIWYARNTKENILAVEKYVDLKASDSSFGVTPDGTVDVLALRKQRLGLTGEGRTEAAAPSMAATDIVEQEAAEPVVTVYSAVAIMQEPNDPTHTWERVINSRCISHEQAEDNISTFRSVYGNQVVNSEVKSKQVGAIPAIDQGRLNARLQDWYVEHYPQDTDMAEGFRVSERKENTFWDLFVAMDTGKDVYNVLPEGADSLVRERMFAEMAAVLGCDYGIIYHQWLHVVPGRLTELVGDIRPDATERGEESRDTAKYELGFGHLGNGITVWNRLEEQYGDYRTVAHISPERVVTYYDKNLSEAVKQKIQDFAEKENPRVSTTQDCPVFKVPAKERVRAPEGQLAQGDRGEQTVPVAVPCGPETAVPEKPVCLADVYDSVGGAHIYRDSSVEGSLWSSVGSKGYYADINAYIWCNYSSAVVIELDNALKRGKTCKTYSLYCSDQDSHCYLVNDCKVNTPKDLYDLVRSGKEMPGNGILTVRENKGVEVFSPFVSVKPLRELPEKWKKWDLVKAIMSGQVFSGVLDQRLTDDYAYDAAVNFGSGRRLDLPGQAADLVEGCRDCYLRTDGVDENGIASIHFSYAGDMKTFLFDVNCDLAEGVRRREATAQALKEHNAELRASVIPVKESDIDLNKVYIVDKIVEDSNTGKFGIESDVVQGFALVERLGFDELTGIREAELVPNKLYQVANFFNRRDYAEEDARIIDTGNWGQVASGKAIEELTRDGVYLHLKTPDYENPRSFEAVKKGCMEFISGTSRFLFGNEVDYSKSLQKLEAEEVRLSQDKGAKHEFDSLADIIGFAEIKKAFEKNQRGVRTPEIGRDADRDYR